MGTVPHPDGFLTIACTPENLAQKTRRRSTPEGNCAAGPALISFEITTSKYIAACLAGFLP
jgi:hypothetical protein